jgi:uncharacterized membrane protein
VFELLFKYPLADFASGTLVWASGRPQWQLALALGVAAVLLALSLWRTPFWPGRARAGWAVLALQIAALGLALALFWRPALRVERVEAGRNRVALLIDTSRSMSFAEGERSRLQEALGRFESDALPALEQRFALDLFAFAEAREPIASLRALPAPGEHSRLSAALLQTLRGAPGSALSAIVVVSDGGDPSGRERRQLLRELARLRIPVHAIGAGRELLREDLELADVRVPPLALAGTRVTAEVTIRHAVAEETQARLAVRDGERLLAARSLRLDPEQRVQSERIELDVGAGGLLDLDFALDPLPQERILGNNVQRRLIEVSARKRRILYVEGEPRWEYKFIRRALAGDPALELVSILRTTTGKLYRQGVRSDSELAAGLGEAVDTLFGYDALILGSVEASAWTPEQHERMREFVATRGGSLLMLGGPQGLGDGRWGASALADALPVRLASGEGPSFEAREARVRLTPHGSVSALLQLDLDPQRNRELWQALPPLADQQALGELKPGAVSLLEAGDPPVPLLVAQRYGRGQAVVLATSGTWRWRMRAAPDDARQVRFWRQLLRTLAASAPDAVQARLEVAPGSDAARARVHVDVRDAGYRALPDAVLEARLQVQGSAPRPLDMRPSGDGEGFDAEIEVEPGAAFRIDAVARRGAEALASVTLHQRAPAGELEDFRPAQDRAFLEEIAAASGGLYWSADALAELPRAVEASPSALTRSELLELWNAPALLLLLLGLCAAEWCLRRAKDVL